VDVHGSGYICNKIGIFLDLKSRSVIIAKKRLNYFNQIIQLLVGLMVVEGLDLA
jgi:hypothetical protein